MTFNSFQRNQLDQVVMTDSYWNPGYGDSFIEKCGVEHVTLRRATADSIRKYGTIVRDFEKEQIVIRQWPQEGTRPIVNGTGIQAGIKSGKFNYVWDEDVALAVNEAGEENWLIITGRLPKDVSPSNRTHVLVREANYHPDGSQVFYPINGNPFVILLAPPGDNVKPEDFEAFYVDGTFGIHIKPFVWHQPLYPADDKATFVGKQCAVYACVRFDSVDEFDVLRKGVFGQCQWVTIRITQQTYNGILGALHKPRNCRLFQAAVTRFV